MAIKRIIIETNPYNVDIVYEVEYFDKVGKLVSMGMATLHVDKEIENSEEAIINRDFTDLMKIVEVSTGEDLFEKVEMFLDAKLKEA